MSDILASKEYYSWNSICETNEIKKKTKINRYTLFPNKMLLQNLQYTYNYYIHVEYIVTRE